MRQVMRRVAFAAVSCLVSALAMPSVSQAGDCRTAAVTSLHALSPDGYAIYEQIPDKHFFLQWITCDDLQLGLATAVHESVHYITAHTDTFPLVDGGEVKRPHEISSFFAPSHIARHFGSSDFVSTYLRPGQASSSTDFLYLLDELNAYTHDLNTAMDLMSLKPAGEEVAHRDGLAALMAFVARYVETAEEKDEASWKGLQQPEVAEVVSGIWGKAEQVLSASCGIPDIGMEDKGFIRRVCEPAAQAAMETILGRAPVCPSRCLETSASSDDTSE